MGSRRATERVGGGDTAAVRGCRTHVPRSSMGLCSTRDMQTDAFAAKLQGLQSDQGKVVLNPSLTQERSLRKFAKF